MGDRFRSPFRDDRFADPLARSIERRESALGHFSTTGAGAWQPIRPRDSAGELGSAAAAATAPTEGAWPPPEVAAVADHWIEIELADSTGRPLAGEAYRVVLPDGTVRTGALGSDGRARISQVPLGLCQVSFPDVARVSPAPAA